MVDVIKGFGKGDKLIWSRGKIQQLDQETIKIAYLNDIKSKTITIDKDSIEIAPYKSKSTDF